MLVAVATVACDAGLLLVRQFDGAIGFTEHFAEAIAETRDGDSLIHDRLSMVRQRIYGILADYADRGESENRNKWQIRRGGVAAEVKVSARRVLVRLSASWPYLDHFAEVSGKVPAMPLAAR